MYWVLTQCPWGWTARCACAWPLCCRCRRCPCWVRWGWRWWRSSLEARLSFSPTSHLVSQQSDWLYVSVSQSSLSLSRQVSRFVYTSYILQKMKCVSIFCLLIIKIVFRLYCIFKSWLPHLASPGSRLSFTIHCDTSYLRDLTVCSSWCCTVGSRIWNQSRQMSRVYFEIHLQMQYRIIDFLCFKSPLFASSQDDLFFFACISSSILAFS